MVRFFCVIEVKVDFLNNMKISVGYNFFPVSPNFTTSTRATSLLLLLLLLFLSL